MYELGGVNYTVEELGEDFQGKSSRTYTILGGFPHGRSEPAILKRMNESENVPNNPANLEIEFLKRVFCLLEVD